MAGGTTSIGTTGQSSIRGLQGLFFQRRTWHRPDPVNLRPIPNINTGPTPHRRVIQGQREPPTEFKTHPDEPDLFTQRVPNRVMHLLGRQLDVVQVVATSSQAVLSLYLLPLPKSNQGPDKDVVLLGRAVHNLCPVLGMYKHQQLGEEVANSHHLAHLLYQ
jgi:2-polyprenyl-6-methoxyphenol hydroxylase-like FAD-dependent oxidoreductase